MERGQTFVDTRDNQISKLTAGRDGLKQGNRQDVGLGEQSREARNGSHSAADFPSIILRDHDTGRSRPTAGRTVRPRTELFGIRRIAREIVRPFAGMLDSDKHRPTVRRHHHTRHFALTRPDQKPPGFAGLRMGGQHHIVPEAGVSPRIDRRGRDVGLNPEQPAGIHINPVRRPVLVPEDGRTVGRIRRIAAKGEDIPTECGFGPILTIIPPNDVPVRIGCARVGRIHRRPRRPGAGTEPGLRSGVTLRSGLPLTEANSFTNVGS